jgi:hypothetical protein
MKFREKAISNLHINYYLLSLFLKKRNKNSRSGDCFPHSPFFDKSKAGELKLLLRISKK